MLLCSVIESASSSWWAASRNCAVPDFPRIGSTFASQWSYGNGIRFQLSDIGWKSRTVGPGLTCTTFSEIIAATAGLQLTQLSVCGTRAGFPGLIFVFTLFSWKLCRPAPPVT
jgi:hypothetical protein